MIRVIIADDENRICMLIQKLINWDEIGMVVVGTANDGLESLELIEKEKPDIVITDIRMPGYDGLEMIERVKAINKDLEFIIISGYSHFEYAKKAIGYGVKDYLLKPINQEELFNALLRVKGDIIRKKGYINLENEYKFSLKNDRYIIRKSFLDSLITAEGNNSTPNSILEINEKFYFHFQPYIFQIVALRLDETEAFNHDIRSIMESTLENLCQTLEDYVFDIEIIIKHNESYILLNYKDINYQLIRDKLFYILGVFNNNISKSNRIKPTIGLGQEVKEIKDIKTSYESAKLAIEDRIIKGVGGLIQFNEIKTDRLAVSEKFLDFSKKFINMTERLDKEGIKKSLFNLKNEISQMSISGRDLKTLILDISNLYDLTIKTNTLKTNYTKEYEKLENTVESCFSVEYLFDELLEYINTSLTLLEEDTTNKNLVQINQAKEYIEANYMNNITLEDVGTFIGFNPSYFSTLFKKETGSSFIEYLSRVRIEKSKDLLRESDLRIQDICLMVGYSDVKYFSKLFIKHTGLKPKDYRKIFL